MQLHQRHIIVPWQTLLFAVLLAGCKEVDDLGVGTPCSVDADCAANEAATQCVTISVDETYCTMECEYPADCPWGGWGSLARPAPRFGLARTVEETDRLTMRQYLKRRWS